VHQHGTPAALRVPVGEVTLSQLPVRHDAAEDDTAVNSWQSAWSRVSEVLPEQVPVHWLFALTHMPLLQSESATQRHAVPPELDTGVGVRVVVQTRDDVAGVVGMPGLASTQL
jgi:hypothetical protein